MRPAHDLPLPLPPPLIYLDLRGCKEDGRRGKIDSEAQQMLDAELTARTSDTQEPSLYAVSRLSFFACSCDEEEKICNKTEAFERGHFFCARRRPFGFFGFFFASFDILARLRLTSFSEVKRLNDIVVKYDRETCSSSSVCLMFFKDGRVTIECERPPGADVALGFCRPVQLCLPCKEEWRDGVISTCACEKVEFRTSLRELTHALHPYYGTKNIYINSLSFTVLRISEQRQDKRLLIWSYGYTSGFESCSFLVDPNQGC